MKSLSTIRRGRITKPLRVVLYGPEGIGKTTFGVDAPEPVVMGAENGTESFDVFRIPTDQLRSWHDVKEWLQELAKPGANYGSLVVDTLDWLEPLIWDHVARANNKPNIAKIGYGDGYKFALGLWREFLSLLDQVRNQRNMWIVLLAHAKVTKLSDPRLDRDIHRWTLKIHDDPKASASDVVKEWADVVLFANFDDHARGQGKYDKRGAGSGRRLIYTQRTVAYDAKNRQNLPAQMELSWAAFYKRAWKAGDLVGPELAKEVSRFVALAENLQGESGQKALAWANSLQSCDRAMMGKALNKIRVQLDEQEEAQETPPGDSPPPEAYTGPDPTQGAQPAAVGTTQTATSSVETGGAETPTTTGLEPSVSTTSQAPAEPAAAGVSDPF